MPLSVFLSFISYSYATCISPGPNNILMLNACAARGFGKSLNLLAGIVTGWMVVMWTCALLSYGLNRVSEAYLTAMRVVGAAYILWLAWKVATGKPATVDPEAKAPSFFTGLLTQFANVKVVIYGMVTFSAFVLPYYSGSLPMLLAFGTLMAAMGASCPLLWGLAGSLFQKILEKHYRPINAFLALVLVYCAIRMFV